MQRLQIINYSLRSLSQIMKLWPFSNNAHKDTVSLYRKKNLHLFKKDLSKFTLIYILSFKIIIIQLMQN